MANKYFKGNFEECTMEKCPLYLYIDNVEDFLEECADDYISDNVDKPGVYQWNDDYEVWDMANSNIEKKVKTIVEQNTLHQDSEIFVDWNIFVTLDSGLCVKINSEPVSMDKVPEVINTLLKPCFFGKKIKEFEIVAE